MPNTNRRVAADGKETRGDHAQRTDAAGQCGCTKVSQGEIE
jgi:hypothetical protein